MTETVHSYCRICQAHCGIVVELEGQQVVRVAGDKDHPVSRGYTCSKGRSLGAMHHDPARLEHPELRGTPASWDAVLGDLAQRLNALVEAHGPDAVACYKSTGWVLDTAARSVADRWMRALGTRQLYSPSTIDTPNRMLVPDLVVGAPFIQPVTDWERSELLVVFGHNLVVSHGHATSVPDPVRRLRAVQDRGGAVIVADPRRTETARLADVHLQLLPGSDVALAAHLVRHRLRTQVDEAYLATCVDAASIERLRTAVDPFDRDATARHCGLDADDLDRATALLDGVQRLSYLSGTGVSMGPAANATEWLGWALGAVTGSLDRDGGMLFNPGVIRPQSDTGPTTMPRITGPPPATHPDLQHAYGEYPTAILCDEILAGHVRALVCFGGNPLGSFPDTPRTRAALDALDVLVIAELRRTSMTEIATHVLATCDQLERHDATFFLDQAFPFPFAQYTAPVVEPVGDRRPLWDVMAELARRMGIDLPALAGIDDEEQLVRSILKRSRVPFDELAAAPSGVVVDGLPRSGWLIPDRVPRGRLDVAPEPLVEELGRWSAGAEQLADGGLRLVCRRLPHQMNADLHDLPAQQRAPFPTLLMHGADAADRGVVDGATVTVASPSGSTEAIVEVTDRIRPGVVSLPHAWASPSVNDLTTAADLDPLTGMPRYTALPVEVVAATARLRP